MSNLNFLVLYFSGTDNTKMVCEEFKRQIEKLNYSVKLSDIDRFEAKNIDEIVALINDSDYIGFAYPVYGANLPPIFDSFLKKLENRVNVNKNAFIITTVGVINAFGPFIIKKRINKFGLKLKWHIVCKIFDNTKFKAIEEKSMLIIKTRIQNEIEYLVKNIIEDKCSLKGIGPWIIGGYVVRRILKKPLREHYKKFYVDKSLCTSCMLCYNKCPTNAINYLNGNFTFNENCTTCFRCRNKCPMNAIKEKHK